MFPAGPREVENARQEEAAAEAQLRLVRWEPGWSLGSLIPPLSTPRILVINNLLFSSSYDRTARVWTVDKGQVSQEFRGHRNCVLTLAYSAPWDPPSAPCAEEEVAALAAGGLLVTGSTDGTAKVWQVASGCCHQTLRGHTGAVLCLVLDAPGHTAFTGSTDSTVRAWDILSGEQLRVFREHQGSVICLEVRAAWPCPQPASLLGGWVRWQDGKVTRLDFTWAHSPNGHKLAWAESV